MSKQHRAQTTPSMPRSGSASQVDAMPDNSVLASQLSEGAETGAVPHLAEMERLFGASFGALGAVTGAAEDLRRMGALAATDGTLLAFAAANPSREQVAHELAHVAQGARGGGATSHASDAAEVEARDVGARAAAGQRVAPTERAAPGIHRDGIGDASAAQRRATTASTAPIEITRGGDWFHRLSNGGWTAHFSPSPPFRYEGVDPEIQEQLGGLINRRALSARPGDTPAIEPNTSHHVHVRGVDAAGDGLYRVSRTADTVFIERIGAPPTPSTAGRTSTQSTATVTERGHRFAVENPTEVGLEGIRASLALVSDADLARIDGLSFLFMVPRPGRAEGGFYHSGPHTIEIYSSNYGQRPSPFARSSEGSEIGTLQIAILHEIGHAVDAAGDASGQRRPDHWTSQSPGFQRAARLDGVRPNGEALQGAPTAYGNTDWGECYAESYYLFHDDPDQLQALRPHLHAWFASHNQ